MRQTWFILAGAILVASCSTPARETKAPEGSSAAPAADSAAKADRAAGERKSAEPAATRAPEDAVPREAMREEVAAAGMAAPAPGGTAGRARPAGRGSPGVKAGFHDDNLEFGAYLDFLAKFRPAVLIPADVTNRIVVRAVDGQGKPASFATLVFRDASGGELARRTTYADGRAVFSPSEYPSAMQGLKVEAAWKGEKIKATLDSDGKKTVDLAFRKAGSVPARIPVDICFVLDTTGSMADEIQRLKDTLGAVNAAIAGASEKPDVRFGMVVYRDRGDQYITRKTDFTGDVERFAGSLALVGAGGGGDGPEDLQAALDVALRKLEWRPGAIRVAFVITDAPPHVYPDEEFSYVAAARNAAARGIKIVGIGASGLSTRGEIVLRHLAQVTMGEFVFLTYGESGDSDEAGSPARVSHHTGANFQTRNLDAIIVRFIRSELMALKGERIAEDDWMEAGPPGGGEDREVVLTKVFADGVRRLLDFTLVPIQSKTPVVVMPIEVTAPSLKAAAETCESHLLLAVSSCPAFQVVERGKDLRQILSEHALGLTGAVEESQAPQVGKIMGAKLLVFSKLTEGTDRPEVLIKLVRTETAEVLAVSLLKLAPELVR